jgi:hypothetical protein
MITKFNNFINEKVHTGDEEFKRISDEIKNNFNPNNLNWETWANPGKFVRYNIDEHRAIEIRFWYRTPLGLFDIPIQKISSFNAQLIDRDIEQWEIENNDRRKRGAYWIIGDDPKPRHINDVSQSLIRDLFEFFKKQNKKFLKGGKRIITEEDPYGEENWNVENITESFHDPRHKAVGEVISVGQKYFEFNQNRDEVIEFLNEKFIGKNIYVHSNEENTGDIMIYNLIEFYSYNYKSLYSTDIVIPKDVVCMFKGEQTFLKGATAKDSDLSILISDIIYEFDPYDIKRVVSELDPYGEEDWED